MYYRGLATRVGGNGRSIRSNEPLSDEQLMTVAPSIFAQEAHESRSDRYVYIPTVDVLNDLRKEGFNPFFAAQSRTRIEGKQEFTKHMIRLRHASQITLNEEVAEIILINSHDGTSSYQMLAGMFRTVCQNGMVCGYTVEDIRVRHKGNINEDVIEGAYTILNQFEAIEDKKNDMQTLMLNSAEQNIFATSALALKYDEENPAPIDASQLLRARRREDYVAADDSVWHTFNRVQENLLKGGLSGRVFDNETHRSRHVTTRAVNSIDNDIKLNRSLWVLAEKMAELKKS